MSWSVSINRALLSLFYDLHCEFTCLYDLHFGCTCLYDLFPRTEDYTVEFQVWVLSCFPAVADPDTVEQLSEQWRVPFPLAKRVAEFFPLLFIRWSRSNSLNAYFPDLCLEEQNLSSQDSFCLKSLIKVTTRVRTRMVFLRAPLGDFISKQGTNIYVTLSVTEDNFRRKILSRDTPDE